MVIRSLADESESVIAPGEDASDWSASFSRDSRLVAYTRVGDSGSQIFVETVPPTGDRWMISPAGGEEPEWLPDEDALVYRNGKDWMIVDVNNSGAAPSFSTPRLLFTGPWVNIAGVEYRMISGRRAVLQRPVNADQTTDRIEVISNWFNELDRILE
jgi:hypothetical protein